MIEERCVTCGVLIRGATRERFEEHYDTHQKAVHGKAVVGSESA